ncbi:hypothetical protein PVAG01_06741 [Phlyctema vagabunda]|uniref:Uncharacterized protein n=1 Tax=Phlyctema vagabunda TaxID=108571 RepID=A0ABR4PH23_9HELO
MPSQGLDSQRRSPSRLEGVRGGLQQLFTGRSSVGRGSAGSSRVNEEIMSPKTPVLEFREHELPSTHIRIPGLSRPGSNRTSRSSNASSRNSRRLAREPSTPISTRPIVPNILQQTFTNRPAPTYHEGHVRNNSRFVGVDPAEAELAELAQAGRRRRKTRPSRTRMLAPKIRSKKIRAKILSSFVSGIFLTLLLTIYLAMSLSSRNESQEFHVLLILVILVTTIFFCHSLIRLCMMMIHPPVDDDDNERSALPSMVGPGGFAEPRTPIRVALARDEEAAGIENEATKIPPPAYGLWRESVRVDPNRIFWQRNTERTSAVPEEETPATGNRPPSYLSDDGVDYAVEAAPRSIAPTTNVPLASQPLGRERWPSSR